MQRQKVKSRKRSWMPNGKIDCKVKGSLLCTLRLNFRFLTFRISFISRIPPPLPFKHIPINPHWLDAAWIIRFRAIDQIADRINFQRIIRRSFQRHFVRLAPRIVVFQPPTKMTRRDDDRHPVMQRRNRRVRRPRDDGK